MAGDWRRIELSREQIRAGELESIRAQLTLFMMIGDLAGDVAVFTRRGKAGGCEVHFPPVALRYAEFVFERHAPCASSAPALLGTTLLAGSHTAVASLLGRFSDVQSFRKMIGQTGDLSVGFLQTAQTKVSSG